MLEVVVQELLQHHPLDSDRLVLAQLVDHLLDRAVHRRQVAADLAAKPLLPPLEIAVVTTDETAEAIARPSGLIAEPDERLAPGADADTVREAIAGRGTTVVTVGHQPDCSEIVLALTGERVPFEPGAVHEVEL